MTKQYIDLNKRIIEEGEFIYNARTGKNCLTIINADLTYDVGAGEFPLPTTRTSYWKPAIAELLGYVRGCNSAKEFRELGTKTWDANANLNDEWLTNPVRKGEDDMGMVYGAVGNHWPEFSTSFEEDGKLAVVGEIDLLDKVYQNLKQGKDDRREIWTFYNPGFFKLGCLRPCMHTHQFSLVNGKLYLNSMQSSADTPLGVGFNGVQVFTLLAVMAQITNNKPMFGHHKLINAHIYEDQLEFMEEQVKRDPFPHGKLIINPNIKTLEDLRTWVTVDDFEVVDYEHHDAIAYPFSV